MRRYSGHGKRNPLALLAIVALLGVMVEAAIVLAVAGSGRLLDEPALALAAGAAPATAPPLAPTTSPAEPSARRPLPRPRVHLEAPRLSPRPAAAPASPPSPVPPTADNSGPVSSSFIEQYLARKNAAMVGVGEQLWTAGRKYNVDPRLLVAISGNETGFGRILTSRYNAFNWFYRGTWDSHFESWDEAIEVVTRGIRQYYLDEGLTTIETLGAKYGPVGAANDPLNLNVNFVPNVSAFLREMGGDPEHLTFE